MRAAGILIGAVIFVATVSSATQQVKVIAHASVGVSRVSSEELKDVFLETRTSLADGTDVEPVLLKGGDVHDAFVRAYIGKTAAGLDSYYRSLVFAGKGAMPKRLASDAEVVAYVKAHKRAIGYVSASASTDGVSVLDVR